MKRLAIVGVGAVGGAVAADLADAGRVVVIACSRTPFEHLVVEHPHGVSTPSLTALSDPSALPTSVPVDWVLIATKAYSCSLTRAGHGLAPWLDRLCGPKTCIAVLQNGVDHRERVLPWADVVRSVVPVVVDLPSERIAHGHVRQARAGKLAVAADPAGNEFASLFEGARTRVDVTADLLTRAWRKLLVNAAVGGVGAVTLRGNGVVGEPAVGALVLALMREVAAVGRAEGAALPDDVAETTLQEVLHRSSDVWSSIAVDRREGRPMEWIARNQVVGRIGRKHGVATPLNDALTALLDAADRPVREAWAGVKATGAPGDPDGGPSSDP